MNTASPLLTRERAAQATSLASVKRAVIGLPRPRSLYELDKNLAKKRRGITRKGEHTMQQHGLRAVRKEGRGSRNRRPSRQRQALGPVLAQIKTEEVGAAEPGSMLRSNRAVPRASVGPSSSPAMCGCRAPSPPAPSLLKPAASSSNPTVKRYCPAIWRIAAAFSFTPSGVLSSPVTAPTSSSSLHLRVTIFGVQSMGTSRTNSSQ